MDKRDKIVAAARQRFRYYGIQKTTMQEIAQDAGVAVGTLYLYFRNKDDLIVACAEDFVQRHRRQAGTLLASRKSPEQKLREYIAGRFREAEETRTSSRHAAEITRAVFRVKPDRLQDEAMLMWETIVKILKLGIQEKVFRVADPEADAKVFLYSIGWFFPNALMEMLTPPREEELLVVVDWFLSVWRGERDRPGRKKT